MAHRGPRPKHSTRVDGARRYGPTLKRYPRNRSVPVADRLRERLAWIESLPVEARPHGWGAWRAYVKRQIMALDIAAQGRARRRLPRGLPPGPRNIAGTLWNGATHKYGPRGPQRDWRTAEGVSFPWSIPALTEGNIARQKAEMEAARRNALPEAQS